MKTFALATAAIATAITASPAFAGNETTRSIEVSIAGLDLATSEGQKLLDQRINAAARKVCGLDEVRTGTRMRSLDARSCYNKARANVKSQVAVAISDQQRGG